jgi:hypothetical protein
MLLFLFMLFQKVNCPMPPLESAGAGRSMSPKASTLRPSSPGTGRQAALAQPRGNKPEIPRMTTKDDKGRQFVRRFRPFRFLFNTLLNISEAA